MLKQIRQRVFETNSSSTHSICVAKNCLIELPESIHFEFGEFGWEWDTLDSLYSKASYLYTGLMSCDREEDFNKIVSILESKGITVTKEKPVWKQYTYEDSEGRSYIDNGGYVDHSDELKEFLDFICENEDNLMNFLFSPLSFIRTGNDNQDGDISINVNYSYDEFYKGN